MLNTPQERNVSKIYNREMAIGHGTNKQKKKLKKSVEPRQINVDSLAKKKR